MALHDDIERLVKPETDKAGVELVHLEYRKEPQGWMVRFYLDKEGGFSLADCEVWNDRLSALLDESNLIQHAYHLEISSPGLDRPLRKPEDFKRFVGIEAVIKLYAARNGQKNFHGRILGVEGEELLLEDRTSGP